MSTFSATAFPGQRWKIYLPDAASMSMTAASALVRRRWLCVCGRGKWLDGVLQCGVNIADPSTASALDDRLDEALEETFPASDPIAVHPIQDSKNASGGPSSRLNAAENNPKQFPTVNPTWAAHQEPNHDCQSSP